MNGVYTRNNYGAIAFNRYLWPILEQIFLEPNDNSIQVRDDYSNHGFGCWCALFCRNSMVLFSSCSQSIEVSQTLFTMRFIMEIAADFNFISKYPDNLPRFRNIYKKYQDNKISSYIDFVPEINRYRLCKYNEDGKKADTSTMDRISECFGENGIEIYKFLCGFTHLNYIGGILDMRFAGSGNLNAFRFVLPVLKMYPDCLEIMAKSAFLITGHTLPKNLDRNIDNKFDNTVTLIKRLLTNEFLANNAKKKTV